jgi:GntR family phosphonate transport system transcriptional regulator
MSVLQIKRGDGSLPVYRQLSDAIRSEIQNYYKAGDLLPSESQLAQRFKVNRHTLRRAVDELVHDGLVVRRHGKGVFVLTPSIEYQIGRQTRFTETLETLGVTTQSRVIRKQKLIAQGGVAKRLKMNDGDEVVFLETLRLVEEKPFCVCSHFIPMRGFESVFEHYNSGSLHQFIEQHCGTRLQRTESLISAVLPVLEDSILLNMPRSLPALRVKSVNVSIQDGRPIEYVITRFRGDAAQLSILPK